ncbi:heparinase II/III family protein [bacterium]|nr:heparinase II/III family protein [bacterium]
MKDPRLKKEIPLSEILKLIGTSYKEHPYTGMFSRKDFIQIKKYIKKYPWAKDAFEKIKKDADYWVSKSDEEIYNFIPPENPRAYCPCYAFGCPICGTGNVLSTKEVLATSLETPNKWRCVSCGRWFGPGEEIEYQGKRFKIIDDDSGWKVPEGLPGAGYKYYFVASYRTYKLYLLFASHRAITIKGYFHPKSAVGTLVTVYAITGDTRYAHKALLILNRVAQLYPTYDGMIDIGNESYMPHISWTTAGEEDIVDESCYAYDIVFDYLPKDKELIKFFKRKGHKDLDGDGKITWEDIRRNIAINLFGYMYEWLLRTRRTCLGSDWIIHHAAQMALIGRILENPDIVYEALEGKSGFRELMRKFCYNDGRFWYNSLGYHFGKLGSFGKVDSVVNGYCDGKRFKEPIDLFNDKTIILEHMANYSQGIICNGRIPGIGDQRIVREKIDPSIDKSPVQSLATILPRYPYLAHSIENKDNFIKNLIAGLNNNKISEAIELILRIPEIEKVVKSSSFRPQRSTLFTDTGLAILRTSHKGIKQVHAILNYGVDGETHSHHDQLALNIIAYGYELTINKGYPYTWEDKTGKVSDWIMNTAAQNVVLIDGKNQTTYGFDKPLQQYAGELHTYQDNKLLGIVDGSNEKVYPCLATLYRRAIFLIKDPEYPFIVDIFNVTGGNIRDYQFHAQSDIEGKNFKIKFKDGTKLKKVKKTPLFIDSRFMYDIKSADTQGDFTAYWWIGDKENTGIVLHMLNNGGVKRTIITGKGQAEGSNKLIPCDPHLIVREKGNKNSQFVSVIFPYCGSVPQYTIESLSDKDGIVALCITLGKKKYFVFYDSKCRKKHLFIYNQHYYTFLGIAGVILEKNNQIKAISLSCGKLLGRDDTVIELDSIKEGKVVSINEEEEKSIIVEGIGFPSKLPSLLKWSNKPWVYRVIRVRKNGNRLKMYLDTFSFIDRGKEQLIQKNDRVFFIPETYKTL